MALDHELPVWTLRPNWSNSVAERLMWMTDVMRSATGHEQAASPRLAPRRSIEATFNPTRNERTFLELCVQRLGRTEWMVPLFFHRSALTAAATATDTTLYADTVDLEFADGGMALLVGPDAFTCEAVRIDTVAADALTLVAPLTGDWPAGTTVHPLRRAWIDASSLESITSRVGGARIRFDVDRGNDLDGGAEEFTLYQGLPVISHLPNWSQRVETSFDWMSSEFDSKTGLRRVIDEAGRAFQTKRYTLMLHGRDEQASLRKLLYRLRGRAVPGWIPSHNDDLTVARSALAGAELLDVQYVGLGYVGGITPDVAHMIIGGDEIVQADDLGGALADDEERLVLAAALSRNIAAGETASFLHLARLEGDTVSIDHLTDSDGVARVSLAFRQFTAGRDGSAAGDFPIPVTAMNSTPCGVSDCEPPPADHVGEIVITLPDPLPLMPLAYVGNRSNVWIGDLQTVILVEGTPEAYHIFDEDFDTRDAVCWTVLTEDHYGDTGNTNPVFAYKYDSATNSVIIRTWHLWAYDAFDSDFAFWLDLYGLATDPPTSLVSSATQANGDAPVALDADPFGSYDPSYYEDQGFDIVEQYMEFMLRKVGA